MNSTASVLSPLLDTLINATQTMPGFGILSPLSKLASLVLPSSPLSTASSTGYSSPLPSVLAAISSLLHHTPRPHLFELEPHIATAAVFFCRFVVITGSLTSSPDGHSSVFGDSTWEFILRVSMAVILGGMAFLRMNYDLICALHLWSHLMPWMVGKFVQYGVKKGSNNNNNNNNKKNKNSKNKKAGHSSASPPPSLTMSIGVSTIILFSVPFCLLLCRLLSNPSMLSTCHHVLPQPLLKLLLPITEPIVTKLNELLNYMFPIQELTASYEIVTSFVSDQTLLHDMMKHLLFVTFHIQMVSGFATYQLALFVVCMFVNCSWVKRDEFMRVCVVIFNL